MPEVFRRFPERRTGKDRRKIFNLHRFFYKGPERRKALQDPFGVLFSIIVLK